ncbi:MAG TPA: NAD(P)H-hydrate dehydratase [Candidatus Marinimicrobia bacterium]|nr:NAD(P)H-hydrate dehydratase [Candidatus Neomarinimicrobiota bacterium]
MPEFILSNAEAAAVDRYAIEELQIPGTELMFKAGNFVALKAKKSIQDIPNSRIDIFCGTGNNGGDGFVAAHLLSEWGANCIIWLIGDPQNIKGDARHFYQKCEGSQQNIRFIKTTADLRTYCDLQESDLIIDAMLGTGFHGEVHGVIADAIRLINDTNLPVIAVDIPSGVNGDTGEVQGEAVRAKYTVTMGFLKRGLLFYPGKRFAGEIAVVDLGYPRKAFNILKEKTFLIGKQDIKKVIPPIAEDTYKHRQGKVLIIAGSPGMTGAATLCALGAMRSGAGLVVNAVPRSLNPIMEVKLTEALTAPVPESSQQTFCPESLPAIQSRIEWSDVVVFGPGVSSNVEVQEFGRQLLKNCPKPLIIDADGLRIFHNNLELIGTIEDLTITPHRGEFAMMTGITVAEVNKNVIEVARDFVRKYPCTLVLKGAPSLVVSPKGVVAVNSTGNPALATGGTGDVLTGIIAAFRAQGLNSFDAAMAGVSIHGLAGDWGRKKLGVRAFIASDLLDYLPMILRRLDKVI